jgi:predicted nucleic acid-binding protein
VIAYFDSSAVLAFLLQQPEGEATRDLWVEKPNRVSSALLKAECLVNLRRNAARIPSGQSRTWLRERLALLATCMEDITLSDIDGSILSVLESEERLADCRTLDALHLATALRFSAKADEGFVVVSLDERMRQIARKLKFEVLPA